MSDIGPPFDFKDLDYLTDGEIDLKIVAKIFADKTKGHVPAYEYAITLHGSNEKIGRIGLRMGYNENIRYGGNIGYNIDTTYRGNRYAAKACELASQVFMAHGMNKIIITCSPDNIASRRTCEIFGAKFIELVDLPADNEMYVNGERQKFIYEKELD